MDLADVFADLDRVAWAEVEHAYGPADDVPGLLRALIGDDEENAAEAEQELWSGLVHQGSVYEATVVAVPFMARLAAAGVRRKELLGLLGAVAESTDERGLVRPGAARAAVVAQVPLLVPLLSDDDPEVRHWAAWVVGQCGPAAAPDASAALRWRWETETDPVVRADVVSASVRVDRASAERLCAAALDASEASPVRVAGLLAAVDTGRPWDGELAAAVAALAPLKRHTADSLWERAPLRALAAGLYERGSIDAAIEVVVEALERAVRAAGVEADPRPAVTEATWAAEALALCSRSAPARLLPAMLPLLDSEATAGDVLEAVCQWGEPAPQAVPALLVLADGASDMADCALAALVSLGAPEASDLLALHLEQRPLALEAAWARATTRRPPAPLPCTAALLDSVRARLAAVTADGARGRKRGSLFEGGLVAVNEPVYLTGLLAGWGRSARAALPELLDVLPQRPAVAGRALAAVADAERDAHVIVALRSAAGTGSRAGRLGAATALHALTGDTGALFAVLGPALGELSEPRDQWVRAAATLGEQARPLLSQLSAMAAEPADTRTSGTAFQAGLAAAGVVWELTGDQEIVLPVILEGLAQAGRPWGHRAANSAAELATRLGPRATPAVPHLLAMLDRPDTAVAAARALVAVHPGSDRPAGVLLTDLVDRVLPAVRPGARLPSALAALDALAAIGPAALTAAQLDRVRALADGDRRIVGSGSHSEIIHDDIEFRACAANLNRPDDHAPGRSGVIRG
ncbi:HEAT repeat domain-containing protein [Streptomyces sp. NPDC001914]|uniref:HEAT repeat domain-containing protein n=1 Tax=Streptomyces sp. NPDC001914 TaxID=3364623 RepID=UPI0036B4CED0